MLNQESNSKTFWNARSYVQKSTMGVIALIAGTGIVIGILAALKSKPEQIAEEKPAPAKVETIYVSPTTKNVSVISQGSVSPTRQINLISEVAGKVIDVSEDYAEGGFFEKDQAIVSIDGRDHELALRQAQSEVARAKEVLAMEKGRTRQAKREWRDIGDKEANDLFLRKPQLESAKAAVDAALANSDMAKLNLARTQISAPFNGRILLKRVDIGQYVTPGTVIAEVYSTEAVQVRLPLTDKQVAQIDLPLTAKARSRQDLPEVVLSTTYGGKTYSWKGKIVRTEASFDVRSRNIFAVVEVTDPFAENSQSTDNETAFKPPLSVGMYVSAEIIGRKLENVVTIPRKVLHKNDQLILVDSENRITFRKINIIQHSGENILVQGLEAGDRVLATRIPYAVAGLEVNPDSSQENNDSENSSAPAETIAEANEG